MQTKTHATLYTLTPADWDALNVQGTDDIIAESPWVCGGHEVPHRIVLRALPPEERDGFIVHEQAIFEGTADFNHGDYYHHREFAAAWARFERRARQCLQLAASKAG